VARGGGPGVALKLESGVGAYLAPVAMAVLRALDLLPSSAVPEDLAALGAGELRSWAGDVVGGTRVRVALDAP
jgi:hypothetical protein